MYGAVQITLCYSCTELTEPGMEPGTLQFVGDCAIECGIQA